MVVARARQIGGQLSISDGSLLDFVESMFASSDVAMVVVAGAHRQAELALARGDQERRAAFEEHPVAVGESLERYGAATPGQRVRCREQDDKLLPSELDDRSSPLRGARADRNAADPETDGGVEGSAV
jgi:hypothetical protein